MTFREQCALAAMREEFRDSLRGSRGLERNYHGNIAREAWLFADAMAAERAKRDQAARRTGRDAPESRPAPEHELPKTHAELGALLMNVLAKAEAENAKLRAVAEAARHAMSVGPDIDADVALMGALDAWRKDWRTK